jgi:hypothetical protein
MLGEALGALHSVKSLERRSGAKSAIQLERTAWCGARGRDGSGAQTSTNLAKNDGTGHGSLLGIDLGAAEGALLGSLLGPASLREKLGDKLGFGPRLGEADGPIKRARLALGDKLGPHLVLFHLTGRLQAWDRAAASSWQ